MKTLFYDDVYRFLYSSNMFQQLAEGEQQRFLQQFAHNEQFIKSLSVAIDFQAHLGKMEATVPVIANYGYIEPDYDVCIQRKLMITDQTITIGNVTYVPFQQQVNVVAPLIIGFDTSAVMANFEIQAKGLILPLLELCAKQRRDCIVLTDEEQFVFPQGELITDVMKAVQHIQTKHKADIATLYERALEIFSTYNIMQDAEFMLLTANTFEPATISQHTIQEFKSLGVELSAIALDEAHFEKAPLLFLDKVFFPNA
ncbi:MAG: hypothetical protein ACI33M_10220 [Lysinibacillus sp.]